MGEGSSLKSCPHYLNQKHTKLYTAQNVCLENNCIYVDAENHYETRSRLQHICIGQYERPIHAQISFAELMGELSNGDIAIAMSEKDARKRAKKAGVHKNSADFAVTLTRNKKVYEILDDPDYYGEDDE